MTTENTTPPVDVKEEEVAATVGAFSAPLYDHEKKEWVETPESEIADKIASGRFTYQTGLKIPVVDAKGETWEIDSDNAYNEYKFNGFRPLTRDHQKAFEERELDKINEANFGGRPVDAFIQGALRGTTLGLSDVVFDAAGVGDAAAQVKERNEGVAFAGEGLGMAATSLGAGLGSLAGVGAKGAVAAGEAAAAKLGSSMAAKVAAKALPAASEGAFFGVGQGISEAALGNPDSVVDSLIGNVSAGALFGGGIGAAFGLAAEAKPVFDKLVERSVNGAGDAIAYAANKVGGKGLTAALNFKQEQALAKQVKGYLDLPIEQRQFIQREGVEGMEALQKELKPLIKEANGQISAMRKDLDSALAGASDEVRHATDSLVKKAGKDIFEAAKLTDDYVKLAEQNFNEGVAALDSWPSTADASTIGKAVEATVARLKNSGSVSAGRVANKLDALYTAHPFTTVADEATFFMKVQDVLKPYRTATSKIDDSSRQLLDDWVKAADDRLLNHQQPAVSELYKVYRAQSQAAETLKGVADRTIFRITKSPMAGESVARYGADGAARVADETKTLRTLLNPQHRQAVEVALSSFDQLAPELKQWQQIQGLKNGSAKITAQQAFQSAVEDKIRQLAPGTKVNVDEIESIFNMIGPVKNVDKQLQKIRDLQTSMLPNESLPTKAIAVMKALGKDVSPQLKRLAQYEKQIHLVQQLQKVEVPGVSPSRMAIGVGLADVAGLALGMQKTNANRYLTTIEAVEQMAAKGARALEKSIKTTTDALVSKPMAKSARAVALPIDKGPSMKEQKARYPELKKALALPPQPLRSAEMLPQISKAVEGKRAQVQSFLQSKLPQDPFEDVSLSLDNTGYQPSDQELSKFYRYVNAVDNPQKVLASLSKGTASPEEVETLKAIYPQVYKALQDSVLDAIIEKKVNLSYKQKLNLSTLFDIPTDPTLRPDFIARMQGTINKDEGGRPEGTGGNRKIQIDIAPSENVATAAQRISNK